MKATTRLTGFVVLLGAMILACSGSDMTEPSVVPFAAELWINGAKVADFSTAIAYVTPYGGSTTDEYIDIMSSSGLYQISLNGSRTTSAVNLRYMRICQGGTPLFMNYLEGSPSTTAADGYTYTNTATGSKDTLSGVFSLAGLNPKSYRTGQFSGTLDVKNGSFNLSVTKAAPPPINCH
jgi:hypothetical protein